MKRIAEVLGRIKMIRHRKAYGIIVVAAMLMLPLGMMAAKRTPAIEVLVDGRVMGYTRSTVEARKALNTAKHQMSGQDGELTLVDTEIEFRTTDEKYKKSNTEAELAEQMAAALEEKNSDTKQLAYTVKIGDFLVTLDSRDAVEEVLEQARAKYNETGDFAVELVADPSKETGSMTTSIVKAAKIKKQQNVGMAASDREEAADLAEASAKVAGSGNVSDAANVKESNTGESSTKESSVKESSTKERSTKERSTNESSTKESNTKDGVSTAKTSNTRKTTVEDKAVSNDKVMSDDETASKSKSKTNSEETAASKAKTSSKETAASKANTASKKNTASPKVPSSEDKAVSKKSSSAKKAAKERMDQVVKVDFAEEIQIQETFVEPGEVSSVEEAVSDITKDKAANEIYRVKSGDTISTIANGHDLTVKEFLKLNKGLKESDAIYPDDEVIITVPKPELTVLVQKEEHSTEKYSANVKYVDNEDLYEGETKVKRKGKQGVRAITAIVNYSNGEEDGREIVSEEIVKEAVAKVVERGTKVRPTFIKPLSGGSFTSGFKIRWGREHKGLDWATPVGTSVFASSSGTVSYAGWMNGYGNCITINHGDGRQTRYAHLSEVQVSVGQSVTQGDKIALSGNTGRSTGPHVHFEILINGTQVNPFDYL